jgi:hypothetical protein
MPRAHFGFTVSLANQSISVQIERTRKTISDLDVPLLVGRTLYRKAGRLALCLNANACHVASELE